MVIIGILGLARLRALFIGCIEVEQKVQIIFLWIFGSS